MIEPQFRALCAACDQILLRTSSSYDCIATPWLHVIRPHPIFLENYKQVFTLTKSGGLKKCVRNVVSALFRLGKALFSDGQLWTSIGELPDQCDVLIISHILNDSNALQDDDFYYGKTAHQLNVFGVTATIVLINHTNKSPANLSTIWRDSKVPRVILASLLCLSSEFKLYCRAIVAAIYLRRIAAKDDFGLYSRVAKLASLQAASGGTVNVLRFGDQIKALVSRLQPRAIVVTYEGHSWERIAFAAARAVSSRQIRCIGYQHAALFNLQHAMQRNLECEYNPDVILTSGHISRSILQRNSDLHDVRVLTLGSNRSFARVSVAAGWKSLDNKSACLVLPEGNIIECRLLFGFSLECAKIMPDIKFIWRLHPGIDYSILTQYHKSFRDLPSNVILSTDDLAIDFTRSRWALYRGSTAIVQAVVSGLVPVYLRQVNEMLVDTLYEIFELHPHVLTAYDFRMLVRNKVDPVPCLEQIQDYCEQVFTPLDASQLAYSIQE